MLRAFLNMVKFYLTIIFVGSKVCSSIIFFNLFMAKDNKGESDTDQSRELSSESDSQLDALKKGINQLDSSDLIELANWLKQQLESKAGIQLAKETLPIGDMASIHEVILEIRKSFSLDEIVKTYQRQEEQEQVEKTIQSYQALEKQKEIRQKISEKQGVYGQMLLAVVSPHRRKEFFDLIESVLEKRFETQNVFKSMKERSPDEFAQLRQGILEKLYLGKFSFFYTEKGQGIYRYVVLDFSLEKHYPFSFSDRSETAKKLYDLLGLKVE